MKQLIYCITAFVVYNTMIAQNFNITTQKSEIFHDDYKRSNIAYIEDLGERGFVLARTLSNSLNPYKFEAYRFEFYNHDLSLLKSYTYQTGDEEGSLLGMYVKDNKVYFVDLRENSKKKIYTCTAYSARIDDLEFTPKELFKMNADYIDTATHLLSMAGMDEDKMGLMTLNPDNSAFAIALKLVKDKKEQHDIYVYDAASLELKFKQEYKNADKDKNYTFDNLAISPGGEDAYYIAYSKPVKKKGKWSYNLSLTSVTKGGIKSNLLEGGEGFPFNVKVVPGKDKITCVGLYITDHPTNPEGFCFFEADPLTLEIVKTKFSKFTKQFMDDRYGKNEPTFVGMVKFRSVYLTDNNDIVFNAEEYKMLTELNTSRNSAQPNMYKNSYSYEDIITGKINSSGDLLWSRDINKKEEMPKDRPYLYSYSSVIYGNNTYYFVNAASELPKLDDNRVCFEKVKQRNSSFYMIRLDAQGNMEYAPILEYDKGDMYFKASYGHIAKKSGEVYFLGYSNGNRQLLRVTLK